MKRAVVLLPFLALTACVYVQNSHVRDKGNEVSRQTVARVEPGKTTKEWVLANLGTPDRIQADKDGVEVYEYNSERTEHSERKFFLLFSIESDKVIAKKITRLVLRNGVVESMNTTEA